MWLLGSRSPVLHLMDPLPGADVKVVQALPRHASGKTTLDTYGRLWPDRDVVCHAKSVIGCHVHAHFTAAEERRNDTRGVVRALGSWIESDDQESR
jgi:hypothetical protein